jgi:hypothetical protein
MMTASAREEAGRHMQELRRVFKPAAHAGIWQARAVVTERSPVCVSRKVVHRVTCVHPGRNGVACMVMHGRSSRRACIMAPHLHFDNMHIICL